MPTKISDDIISFNIDATDAAAKRPILALEAARIFAKWANVEFALASMTAVLFGNESALNLLDELKSNQQKISAIKKESQRKIEHEETQKLITRVFRLVEKSAAPRNKLAHCMWGTLPEIPNALLLCEPKSFIKASRLLLNSDGNRETTLNNPHSSSFQQSFKGQNEKAQMIYSLMRDNTEVWFHEDFDPPLILLDNALFSLSNLTTALSTTPEDAAAIFSRNQIYNSLDTCEKLY